MRKQRRKKPDALRRIIHVRLHEDEYNLVRRVVQKRKRYKTMSDFARQMLVLGSRAEFKELNKDGGGVG